MKHIKLDSLLTSRGWLYSLGSAAVLYLLKRLHSRPQQAIYDAKSTVFITGCDSGLGYSLAIYCKEKLNLHVIASCLSKKSIGADKLQEMGVTVVVLDLSSEASISNCYIEVEEILRSRHSHLKVLINNAAVMTFGEFDWRPIDSIEKEISVNLLGPVRLTKLFLDVILTNQTRVINICSHCSLETLPGLLPYAMSKSAMLAWTNGLRLELAKYNINVVAVVPGAFYTQSSIMSEPEHYISVLRETMSRRPQSVQDMYGDYFHTYMEYVGFISKFSVSIHKPVCIQDAHIMGNLRNALTDEHPRAVYMCNNLMRYRIYHTIFRLLPTSYLKDKLIFHFMQMPKYDTSVEN